MWSYGLYRRSLVWRGSTGPPPENVHVLLDYSGAPSDRNGTLRALHGIRDLDVLPREPEALGEVSGERLDA